MKQIPTDKKLTLEKETIARLTSDRLGEVYGGATIACSTMVACELKW